MKILKLTLGILTLFCITLTSCKKETKAPENTSVKAEDLLGYQMVWFLTEPDGTQNLRLLYFDKEGDVVKATLDGITSRIIKTVKLDQNIFKLDLQENGSVVYTFEFGKKDGELMLISGKFYNINNPNYEAAPGMLKRSDFIPVNGKAFRNAKINEIIIFNLDRWRHSSYPNLAGSFYECGTGGWKGVINGQNYMGAYWDSGNGKIMLLQKAGDREITFFNPY